MQQGDFETKKISVDGKEIDYALARRLSEDIVSAIITKPILMAWFDGKKARNIQKFLNASTNLDG